MTLAAKKTARAACSWSRERGMREYVLTLISNVGPRELPQCAGAQKMLLEVGNRLVKSVARIAGSES